MSGIKASFLISSAKVKKSMDTFGKGDPYVTIKIGSAQKKTTVEKNTQSPVWNQSLNFDNISVEDAQNVLIIVLDYDTDKSSDLIGNATLNLKKIGNNKQQLSIPVHDDAGKESATLNFEVTVEGMISERAFGPSTDGISNLGINVIGGKTHSKQAGPYVTIKVAGTERSTLPAPSATDSPSWNQQLSFQGVTDALSENVSITLYGDKKKTVVGTANVTLRDYKKVKGPSSLVVKLVSPKGVPDQGSVEVKLEFTEP